VKLDESAGFNGVNLSTDMREELDRIERLRSGGGKIQPQRTTSPSTP